MPPVTAAHWSGVKEADQLAPICPQKSPTIGDTGTLSSSFESSFLKNLTQQEDCLYLNIFTPISGNLFIIIFFKNLYKLIYVLLID